jgi:hypothetical protein
MGDLLAGEHLAGLLLAGAGLAGVLLVGPTAFVPAAIWTGPEEASLRLIAKHRLIWRAANVGFAIATVMTAAGLFVLPPAVGDGGTSLALAAAVAFVLAGALWLVALSIRLAITPSVAAGFVADGSVEPDFEPLARLGHAAYLGFIFIGGAAVVGLGGAILLGGALSAFVGWTCVVAGGVIVGGYLVFGDMLPAAVYVPTVVVGVAVLLATP